MRLERERADGRRDFWEAEIKKSSLAINAGIVNIRHKRETKAFSSKAAAAAALEKLVATKRKAGFTDPVALAGQFLPAPLPTNRELEAALREAKADAGSCGVYADWLLAHEAPAGRLAGELCALAAALEKKPDARKQKRLDAIARELGLPTDDFATWTYRHGFWQMLHLQNDKDWMEPSFDPLAFAHRVFATPLCAALEELRIGILRWDYNEEDVPATVEAAASYGWSKSLAHLYLGAIPDHIDMDHHVIGDVGKRITKSFPALRTLRLHSGAQAWRGGAETFGIDGLALPKLEALIVETCAMSKPRLRALLAARLPALARLELWFGSPGRDASATLAELAPLVTGKAFPELAHLGMRNQEFGAELVERLAAGKLAERLVTLDLSMSTLDDEDAAIVARLAPRFTALEQLNVDDNFLSKRGIAALAKAFPKVISKAHPRPTGRSERIATCGTARSRSSSA